MEVSGGQDYYLLDPIDFDPVDIDLDRDHHDHPKRLPRHHEKPLTCRLGNDGDFRREVSGLTPACCSRVFSLSLLPWGRGDQP